VSVDERGFLYIAKLELSREISHLDRIRLDRSISHRGKREKRRGSTLIASSNAM